MEAEADEVGLQLASKACFDIREAPVVWAKMNAISEMKVNNFIDQVIFFDNPFKSTITKLKIC